jgi:hypothetical protein
MIRLPHRWLPSVPTTKLVRGGEGAQEDARYVALREPRTDVRSLAYYTRPTGLTPSATGTSFGMEIEFEVKLENPVSVAAALLVGFALGFLLGIGARDGRWRGLGRSWERLVPGREPTTAL